MANSSMLKAKGLFTFSNFFSSVPEGALLEADNVIIDRDGIIEPRRGIKNFMEVGTDTSKSINQLFIYKNRILSYIDSKLYFDSNTAITTDGTISYTFNSPSDYRIKGIESQGNFYFTSHEGVKKLSLSSESEYITTPGSIPNVSYSGGVRSLDVDVALDLLTQNGFLPANGRVAYRVVWGTKDINSNLILGYPSSNVQIYNSSSIGYSTTVTIQVPASLLGNANYFYQIYRSQITTATIASDEMNLIYEASYNGVDTIITVSDNTPEDIRNNGTPLYTNEYSGTGINSANSAPPLCQDITLYKNIAFFSNTSSKQYLKFNLQGMDGLVELNGKLSNSNRITTLTNLVGTITEVTFAGTGHGFNFPSTQDVVVYNPTGSTLGIHSCYFSTANKLQLSGISMAGADTTLVSIFPSYIDLHHTTTDRYFFVGRAAETKLHINTGTPVVPATQKSMMTAGTNFLISNADNKINYMFWYKKTTTDTMPTLPSGYIPVTVDISDAGITTDLQIANSTAQAINSTGNFIALVDETSAPEYIIDITNMDSGPSSAPSMPTSTAGWSIVATLSGLGESISNKYIKLSAAISVGQAIELTAKSLTKILDRTQTDFNFYYSSSVSDLPGLITVEASLITTPKMLITSNILSMTNGILGTGKMFNPEAGLDITTTLLYTSSEIHKNRIYYSKTYEPESVPALNFIDIGPKDKQILRIVALRDSLFIFKEEGTYRLTGSDSTNFYVALFDSSSNIIAPDTATVLNNQIYLLSTQGVASVTETGVGIISRPIENIFSRLTSGDFSNFSTASFGCSYESDRSLFIFTVQNKADTYATRVYRFNTFTQAWTSWSINARSAIVNSIVSDNKLYIGGIDNVLSVERKTLTRKDYADKEYPVEIAENGVISNSVQVSSVANITVGDTITQIQYLTLSHFNQLLRQLDLDSGYVGAYYDTFKVSPSENISRKLRNLTTALNTVDASLSISSGNTNFVTTQTEFNTLVTQLNSTISNSITKNYVQSIGTVEYELYTLDYSYFNNTIIASNISPILAGEATIYKAIVSKVSWAPLTFGDPSMLKHVRSGTMMFEKASIISAAVGFSTDLSPNIEYINFSMVDDGSFGNDLYNNSTWGGDGTGVPMRTLIPRQKQRCRYIKPAFSQQSSFDKFSIIGVSFTLEMTSDRGYR